MIDSVTGFTEETHRLYKLSFALIQSILLT
jgi:hypothetical protein